MRLFIACHIDIDILNKIEKFISPFRKQYQNVKWVPVHNMHLTLKFLGEVNEELLTDIQLKLSEIQQSQFQIQLYGVGAFPNMRFPKIFWLGINDENNEFTELFHKVEAQLEILGFQKEKRAFSPHLTLCRFKDKIPKELTEDFKPHKDLDFGIQRIRHFSLIQSKLKSSGAEYTVLNEYRLLS